MSVEAENITNKDSVEPYLTHNSFVTSDGSQLFLTYWKAKSNTRLKRKVNLVLLHGLNEYALAFDSVGKYLSSKGISVWSYDQRGFGRNEGLGRWFGHDKMASDLSEFTDLIRKQDPNALLISLGMSMGGAVTLYTSAIQKLNADGMILVAPAVWTSKTQPFYQRWALSLAATFFPSWAPSSNLVSRKATDNIDLLREIWKLPYMIRKTRIEVLSGLVRLMNEAHAKGKDNQLPVLLLYGNRDELIPKKPIEELWCVLNKSSNDNYIQYPKGWHMLMRDLNGQAVLDDIIQWIGILK